MPQTNKRAAKNKVHKTGADHTRRFCGRLQKQHKIRSVYRLEQATGWSKLEATGYRLHWLQVGAASHTVPFTSTTAYTACQCTIAHLPQHNHNHASVSTCLLVNSRKGINVLPIKLHFRTTGCHKSHHKIGAFECKISAR